jgi:hypothetical protein
MIKIMITKPKKTPDHLVMIIQLMNIFMTCKDWFNRMEIAGDYLGAEEGKKNHETRENTNAGNFRYLPSSPHQESSGVVPERFRAGRESLSVVRNVTVRDSKRTKARVKDDDYKRRVSISPSTLL